MTLRRALAHDEPAFVRLLRRVYGDSYSYRDLYDQGGFARLLASGRVLSFGDFDDQGELFGHTAFLLKDPTGDYIESGMSFRSPTLRSSGRADDDAIWSWLFQRVPAGCAYLHQQTTTFHRLAQRHAARHMRARPSGFIVDYAVGEHLTSFAHAQTPMLALSMTTELAPAPARTVLLPETHWTGWLAGLLSRWGRRVERVPASPWSGSLSMIEENAALGLRRRAVQRRGAELLGEAGQRPADCPALLLTPVEERAQGAAQAERIGSQAPATKEPAEVRFAQRAEARAQPAAREKHASRMRIELVHLPLDARAAGLPDLLAIGYLPVGVRLHGKRPDEVVLQYLPQERLPEWDARLAEAKIHGDEARELLDGWRAACAPRR